MLQFFTKSLDVAYMGIVPFLIGIGNGLPLRCIGVSLDARSTHGIVIGRHASTTQADPLRIATVFGSSAHFLAKKWAEQNNIRANYIDLEPERIPSALASGFIDGASIWEPILTRCTADSRIVATGLDLCEVFPDLIVASEEYCRACPGELEAFLEFHRAISHELATTNTHDELARTLLGLRQSEWSAISRDAFGAPPTLEGEYRSQIGTLALEVRDFLSDQGLGTFDKVDIDEELDKWIVRVDDESDPDTELMRLAYSDDIMCLPLLVGELTARDNAHFDRKTFRASERLAKLPREMRKELNRVAEVLPVQPTSAVLELGRLLEGRARDTARALNLTTNSKSIAAVWTQLEEEGYLDAMTATSAHYIRSVRNALAHEGQLRHDLPAIALDRAIDVYEWFANPPTVRDQCARCKGELKPEWNTCPRCGESRNNACSGCGKDLEAGWSSCPYCGTGRR